MDILRGPCTELAAVTVVPQQSFDANNKQVAERLLAVLDALKVAKQQNKLSSGLGDYVYFPIHHLLEKDSLSDRQSEYMLSILTILFNDCWNTVPLQLAIQMLSITAYIVRPETPGVLGKIHESSAQVHTAAFECASAIVKAADRSGLIVGILGSPPIPHIFTSLLASIQYDSDLSAHMAALDALNLLWSTFLTDQRALLIPGTASKLVNFALMLYEKAHVKARAYALTTFGTVVASCLADNLPLSETRDEKWKSTTVGQVNRSLDTLKDRLPNSNPTFVQAMVTMADEMAKKCNKSLNMESIIDILSFGAASNFDTVSSAALSTLNSLRKDKRFAVILDKHAVGMVNTLTTKFNSHDETQTIVTLDSIRRSLTHANSEAFLNSLLMVIDKGLVITKPKNSQLPKTGEGLALKNFGVDVNISPGVEQALVQLLHELGRLYGKSALFTLLDRVQSTPNPLGQMQLLWIAANVLENCEADFDTVFDYLDYTFEVVSSAGSLSATLPPSLTSLSVNLLGRLATKLGDKFQDQLVDVLFPVVNLLGSESPIVTSHTQFALKRIAKACGYNSVGALVKENPDYVLDGVSVKLNTMDISPATPTMLSALIKIVGGPIIPYLDDIAASLFVILDNYHGYSVLVTGIFAVFTTIVNILAKDVPRAIKSAPSRPLLHFDSLQEMLAEFHRKPTVPDLPETEPSDLEASQEPKLEELDPEADDIDAPMPEEEEWTSPVPKGSYMIAKKIMLHADKFLTHKSAGLRRNLLVLITTCLPVLATSDKEFLPTIHKVWPVLVSRLEDPELFVVEAALECLGGIGVYSGDFVSSRFQDLWPVLESKYAPLLRRAWPQFSPEARMLFALEKCLVQLIGSTPLDAETLGRIISAFKPGFARNEYQKLYHELDHFAGDQLYIEMAP